eukprot:scaffold9555_cov123-Isochrysis_galbana.AAC.2
MRPAADPARAAATPPHPRRGARRPTRGCRGQPWHNQNGRLSEHSNPLRPRRPGSASRPHPPRASQGAATSRSPNPGRDKARSHRWGPLYRAPAAPAPHFCCLSCSALCGGLRLEAGGFGLQPLGPRPQPRRHATLRLQLTPHRTQFGTGSQAGRALFRQRLGSCSGLGAEVGGLPLVTGEGARRPAGLVLGLAQRIGQLLDPELCFARASASSSAWSFCSRAAASCRLAEESSASLACALALTRATRSANATSCASFASTARAASDAAAARAPRSASSSLTAFQVATAQRQLEKTGATVSVRHRSIRPSFAELFCSCRSTRICESFSRSSSASASLRAASSERCAPPKSRDQGDLTTPELSVDARGLSGGLLEARESIGGAASSASDAISGS